MCGKGDLNSRTPTGLDSESSAFDQTWQFPRSKKFYNQLILMKNEIEEYNYLKFLYLLNFPVVKIKILRWFKIKRSLSSNKIKLNASK